jgi:hypothetical protein
VVEARKQHYQQASPAKKAQNAATESAAAAAGHTAVGAEPGPAEKKARRIRFLGLGRDDRKDEDEEKQDQETRGWRCLRCWR